MPCHAPCGEDTLHFTDASLYQQTAEQVSTSHAETGQDYFGNGQVREGSAPGVWPKATDVTVGQHKLRTMSSKEAASHNPPGAGEDSLSSSACDWLDQTGLDIWLYSDVMSHYCNEGARKNNNIAHTPTPTHTRA